MKLNWRKTWQYKRILEVLNDYWLTCPDEEFVEVKMYFRNERGEEQTKDIVWAKPRTGSMLDTETYRVFQFGPYAWPKEARQNYVKWSKTNCIGATIITDADGEEMVL